MTVTDPPFTRSFTATDPNGDAIRLSATGGPDTLTLSDDGAGGGMLTGTPTEAGTYTVEVRADDTGTPSQAAKATFVLPVEPAPLPDAGPLPPDAAVDAFAADAGPLGATVGDGCGCRAAGRGRSLSGAMLLMVALFFASRNRRR